MSDFSDKVVFITGGTSGIGRVTAIEFAKQGAHVAFTGRREAEGEETLKAIQATGAKGLFVKSDVSKEADVKSSLQQTRKHFGPVDIAFNNAGIEETPTPFLDQKIELFDNVFQINVRGMWLCLQGQIAQMMESGKGGCIVNNASIAGLLGLAGVSTYTASKHAVIGLSKSLAVEFAKKNVRINVVAPGPIQTDMLDRFVGPNPEMAKFFEEKVPAGRIGTAEEVASAVLWLCSASNKYVIGQTIAVDGGMVVT